MGNHFFQTFRQALKASKVTEESVKAWLENTDFFLKMVRIKIESQDPEMQKQAIEELREFRRLLEEHQRE